MTTLAPTTQVHRDEHGVVALYSACDLVLRQVDGFDPDIALGTLLQHHPASSEAMHRSSVPAGWGAAAA